MDNGRSQRAKINHLKFIKSNTRTSLEKVFKEEDIKTFKMKKLGFLMIVNEFNESGIDQ